MTKQEIRNYLPGASEEAVVLAAREIYMGGWEFMGENGLGTALCFFRDPYLGKQEYLDLHLQDDGSIIFTWD